MALATWSSSLRAPTRRPYAPCIPIGRARDSFPGPRTLLSPRGSSVHLHHAQPVALPPARPAGAREHKSLVLPRREDRCARRERRGQVEPAADHGGGGRRALPEGAPPPRAYPPPAATRGD